MHDPPGRNSNNFTGFWIVPHPRSEGVRSEHTEVTKLTPFTFGEPGLYRVEDRPHRCLSLGSRKPRKAADQAIYKFALEHGGHKARYRS